MSQSKNKKNPFSELSTQKYKLFLLNDNDNTFDYIINNIIEQCNYNSEQAEQCALLAHIHGKYELLNGDKEYLQGIQHNLSGKNIKTEIR